MLSYKFLTSQVSCITTQEGSILILAQVTSRLRASQTGSHLPTHTVLPPHPQRKGDGGAVPEA